jgi:hypothetical protein
MATLARGLASAIILFISAGSSELSAQQIWFGPHDNLVRPKQPPTEDFDALFLKGAPGWPHAAAAISALAIAPYYVDRAPTDSLRRVVSFVKARNLRQIIGLQALPVDGCGRGVEGMAVNRRQPIATLTRFKKAGGQDPYLEFDEPLTYGHFYTRHDACRYSVSEVAQRLAMTAREAMAMFPNAKFIDAEVVNQVPLSEWMPALSEWLDDYRREVGRELDWFAMDVGWRREWISAARETTALLHSRGVKVAVFVGAPGGPGVTDTSWMEATRGNMSAVLEANLGIDAVWITSWTGHPAHNLPEDDPLTLTSLINSWVAMAR